MLSKFGFECYGFRQLFSPTGLPRLSPCLLSTNSRAYQSLPRLPVPPLEQTMERYIKSVKPLLTNEEFSKSKQIVQDFKSGVGQKLQKLLEEKAKTEDNWLGDWWLHSAYLDYRSPVVVYSNPGLVFPFQNFSNKGDALKYAAKIILAAMDYKNLIDNNKIKQEMMGRDPLDMSQYKKIFGTCRIPGVNRDSLSYNDSDYIVVFHNGHVFQLHLFSEDNNPLSLEQVTGQLEKIVNASPTECEYPIGLLTSEHRDIWAKAYEAISQDGVNKSNLDIITKSLFVFCLDKSMVDKNLDYSKKQTLAGKQTIHGGGSDKNSYNRWFDKTIQFIVSDDGTNGLTYEHSPAEGQPIAVLTDHIVNFIEKGQFPSENASSSKLKDIMKLEFQFDNDVKRAFEIAKIHIDMLTEELDLNCFTFSNFGKNFIKSQKLSPDSFIQMAMQFAFYRLHKTPAAHYESAATRKYIGGRTETIRSCSEESVSFAKIMLDDQAPVHDKAVALKLAIKSHKDYSVQAVHGFGVDRHLLGLKLIAIENSIDIPKLYSDPSFVKSTYMRISSSQVAAKCDSFMCYAPLVSDGYATCYNPRDDTINFATAAFKNPDTNVNNYRRALENSLMDMHNVLVQSVKSKL